MSTQQIILLAMQEIVFIIHNAPPIHTNWAAAIEVVSKSMPIDCTEIHTQLCQLFNAFNVEDVTIRVSVWAFNCKKSPFRLGYRLSILMF